MNAGKNTIPDISANVLRAEKNNGCVCSEKSDNRSCDKLDQYRDDQAKSNGDHHGIAKCLLCTVILSGTDILSCECRNSRKHGRRNQEQKADDFFHNADSSGCVQSAPVGNDRNNNESNLNKIDVATDEIDNRVITLDTTKATKAEVSTLVQDVAFEEKTGIITITKKNGSKIMIDTQMEKIAVNFSYNAETQQII